jgi:membrane protease subunit HflC
MQAYVKGLKAGETRMLMTPNSDFFRYFNDPSGKVAGSKGAAKAN